MITFNKEKIIITGILSYLTNIVSKLIVVQSNIMISQLYLYLIKVHTFIKELVAHIKLEELVNKNKSNVFKRLCG